MQWSRTQAQRQTNWVCILGANTHYMYDFGQIIQQFCSFISSSLNDDGDIDDSPYILTFQ